MERVNYGWDKVKVEIYIVTLKENLVLSDAETSCFQPNYGDGLRKLIGKENLLANEK